MLLLFATRKKLFNDLQIRVRFLLRLLLHMQCADDDVRRAERMNARRKAAAASAKEKQLNPFSRPYRCHPPRLPFPCLLHHHLEKRENNKHSEPAFCAISQTERKQLRRSPWFCFTFFTFFFCNSCCCYDDKTRRLRRRSEADGFSHRWCNELHRRMSSACNPKSLAGTDPASRRAKVSMIHATASKCKYSAGVSRKKTPVGMKSNKQQ